MGFFDLESCCFCFGLKTGNIYLGVTNAIVSALYIIAIFISEGKFNNETGAYDAYSGDSIFFLIICLMKFLFDLLFIYAVVKGISKVIRWYYIMYLVFVVIITISLIFSILSGTTYLILGELIHLIIVGYGFLMSRSYYKQLQEHEQI